MNKVATVTNKTIPDNANQAELRWCRISLATVVLTLLAVTISALAIVRHWDRTTSWALNAVFSGAILLLLSAPAPCASRRRSSTASRQILNRAYALRAMVFAMSPVLLLGFAFPLAADRIMLLRIDDVPLTTIILGVSTAVPWVAQMACMPFYQILSSVGSSSLPELYRHNYASWRTLLCWSLPPAALIIIPVALITRWGVQPLLVYLTLSLLHVVFVQSLVINDVAGRKGIWSLAWLSYGIALLVVPSWWFLPPVLGAASQILLSGRNSGAFFKTQSAPIDKQTLVTDMLRGLITGAVLWSDKFLLFLSTYGHFRALMVYLCLQPAVLAYSYYFAVESPGLNTVINEFHQAIQRESLQTLKQRAKGLSRSLNRALLRAGAVGLLATLVVALGAHILVPDDLTFVLVILAASWMFMVLTLLCYELDHAGDRTSALVLSILHLLVALVAFSCFATLTVYLVLAIADLTLSLGALVLYRMRWSTPEYTFFWGKAVAW